MKNVYNAYGKIKDLYLLKGNRVRDIRVNNNHIEIVFEDGLVLEIFYTGEGLEFDVIEEDWYNVKEEDL